MVYGRISHFKGTDLQQLSITGESLITQISNGKAGRVRHKMQKELFAPFPSLRIYMKPLSRRRYRAKKASLV